MALSTMRTASMRPSLKARRNCVPMSSRDCRKRSAAQVMKMIEHQHHPQPVKAPVNVPERADLDEARLAHAAAVGWGAEELARLLHGPAEAVEHVTAPEVLVDVVVVPPGGVRRGAAAAALDLRADDGVDGRDDAREEGVLAVHGGVGGATGGVVAEQLLADSARDAGVERVGEIGGGEAHLRVGEEEHEVLPLVPDVVALEAEEGAEPVHEVVVGAPLRVGRRAQAPDRPQRRRGRAHLREPQRRVVGEEVVDGEDVVGLAAARGRRRCGGRAALGGARRGHAGIWVRWGWV
nr:unnamed protein product [Digitaria exilis]